MEISPPGTHISQLVPFGFGDVITDLLGLTLGQVLGTFGVFIREKNKQCLSRVYRDPTGSQQLSLFTRIGVTAHWAGAQEGDALE